MEDLSINNWKWEGIHKDERILKNMIGLWSPYIAFYDLEFIKATSKPSHRFEVSYDFTPFVNSYTNPEGIIIKDMEQIIFPPSLVYNVPYYIKTYPVMKNMNVVMKKARDLISYGIKDKKIRWQVGHYYMGGGSQSPLIIYIDDKEELDWEYPNEFETIYTVYVLNLFGGDGGIHFNSGEYDEWKWKGTAKPWFNVYKVPKRKIGSDYKLDITDWIDGAKMASFMNWKENPLEVK
jgi:hypothetical protein